MHSLCPALLSSLCCCLCCSHTPVAISVSVCMNACVCVCVCVCVRVCSWSRAVWQCKPFAKQKWSKCLRVFWLRSSEDLDTSLLLESFSFFFCFCCRYLRDWCAWLIDSSRLTSYKKVVEGFAYKATLDPALSIHKTVQRLMRLIDSSTWLTIAYVHAVLYAVFISYLKLVWWTIKDLSTLWLRHDGKPIESCVGHSNHFNQHNLSRWCTQNLSIN